MAEQQQFEQAIFLEAIEMSSPRERAAFIVRACGGNSRLQADVEALLAADFPAVFLPVQAVGASDEHKAFAGTLTLSPETTLRAFI